MGDIFLYSSVPHYAVSSVEFVLLWTPVAIFNYATPCVGCFFIYAFVYS